MKKLTMILATLMVVAVGSLMAQNHRHTDRSNTAAIESIASSNAAALDTIQATDVDTEFSNFVSWDNDDNSDENLAKTAIIAVFGTLSILFLSPVLIVLIILYFRHKNTQMKNKIALEAIEKGVPIPDDKAINALSNDQTSATQSTKVSTPVKMETPSKIERAIKKIAIGTALAIGGWFLDTNVLIAIGAGFLIYGVGLICIDQFVDRKKD